MRIELDVSLEKPTDLIDLEEINEYIMKEDYKILNDKISYILIDNSYKNLKIRVHRDGRIYIKKDIIGNDLLERDLLTSMVKDLKNFLNFINTNRWFKLKSELNFSFFGKEAYSFFWNNYDELNQIAEESLDEYNIRTYADDRDTLYIKLESLTKYINILAA
jgi:hypothetical protein